MPHPVLLGWREWLSLPDLGIVAVRAKVDTGARSSALHVLDQEILHLDGVEHVRFLLDTGVPGQAPQPAQARVIDRRRVTDSGGHTTERVFIRTPLRELLPRLAPGLFMQINRGIAVRASLIDRVVREDNGRIQLHLKGAQEPLPVSRSHAHLFKPM